MNLLEQEIIKLNQAFEASVTKIKLDFYRIYFSNMKLSIKFAFEIEDELVRLSSISDQIYRLKGGSLEDNAIIELNRCENIIGKLRTEFNEIKNSQKND